MPLLCLRPGYPSATRDTRRPQARDGHGDFDRTLPARSSEATQLIVGRTAQTPLRLFVLLLALLSLLSSPVPCCGFHAGLTAAAAAGWLTSPSQQQQQQQQQRVAGCCLERSHAESSRGGALPSPAAAAAAGSGGESHPRPHRPSRMCAWCVLVSARGL